MPFLNGEALTLRTYDLDEADKIVVFFTQRYGKIRAVAPGAKRTRSRFGSAFEPLTYLQLSVYEKEGAELGRVSHTDILYSPYTGGGHLYRTIYCSYFCELINEFTQARDANDHIFRLALATLQALDTQLDDEAMIPYAERLARYVEAWMLKLEGYWPSSAVCARCQANTGAEPVRFYLNSATVLCRRCSDKGGLAISSEAQAVIHDIFHQHPAEFAAEPLNSARIGEIEQITHRLIVHHLDRPLKSHAPIKQLIKGVKVSPWQPH
ncbi:MAG: DNA repair protein RecO [Acidobacteria bacterium]|nr:DNA repair protein RecO [Acidobacteriota bacterium]MBI3658021.1 DNA repair protein RecO [Acidobacteriota bacterium]